MNYTWGLMMERAKYAPKDYIVLKEVPAEFVGKRKVALDWLIKNADEVSILKKPKGRSMYSIYFDDGAYKGGTSFKVRHDNLTPLKAYLIASETGWPGYMAMLRELEGMAEEIMIKELDNDQ